MHRPLTSAGADSKGNIFVVEGNCSHQRVFPRCAAVVHHGGAGTVAACLAIGIPQSKIRQDKGQAKPHCCFVVYMHLF